MTIKRDYSTQLSVDGVTIDQRDIEMLDAIDQYGSMHRAADALGRSYARLQNRVVEIEEAVGTITERQRGGRGGGGTKLTQTAHEIRQQFNRHEAELGGVAHVTESVFPGTVRDRTGELATVDTEIGSILALVPQGATDVQVTVRSDAVVLTKPDETPQPDGVSLRNQFTGTVDQLEPGDVITRVTIQLQENNTIQSIITKESVDRLALEPDLPITASFKATAARGISAASDTRE
ncbi:ModE family transcription regulator (plasmid) [Natrialba magadii ATCC 43099]|uniref:ModE family transcription regulator n=1 Tax=Natrialba magadii (strain ATCC 43099 / DSM 3394 / CCM 3739 / CIP 104546 / IAM 13178 / JCM 8861 / NBRC 102185 / NCIMB 2190 / MS3) TaxID=547559 RepID=D3T1P5_NATMM|nr:TOBE domain-containing protein [Natrialba magadii]ADD07504.1 ModE family transcription regulator [Natrialba magadii ATCC 43099]ELY26536.1 ModE family transcriptional regulator [Natrialba magadii ATCC 43099]